MIVLKVKALIQTMYYWIKSVHCIKKSIILSSEETVRYILDNKKSLIRYGDGEFYLMDGNSIHYQKYTEELRDVLYDIVMSYIQNTADSKYLLCMPKRYFECTGFHLLRGKVYIRSWVRPRYVFSEKYDLPVNYGDAFLFTKENTAVYERIWNHQQVRKVLFVHNDEKYANSFADLYKKEVFFIKIPAADAFERREVILTDIINTVQNNSADMVLISAGPCAKYLVQRLAAMGIWAIDTGHCWDEPLV